MEAVPLRAVDARRLLEQLNTTMAKVVDLIGQLYVGRAWEPLGYDSWDALCRGEVSIPRLSRDERAEVVLELRTAGLSTRAIGAALGVNNATVARDLSSVANATVHVPETVTSLDGRTRPATQPARPETEPTIELIDDDCATVLVADTEYVVIPDPDLAPIPDYKPTKPDLGGGISHPARYSDQLFPHFIELLQDYKHVLDPFAGTGKVHMLQQYGHQTVGVEIEPEWAAMHPDTLVGDALCLPFPDHQFDAICTSPTYGNRLADHHNAQDGSIRRSYTHDLGRTLHANNSGWMQWGYDYTEFHEFAWPEILRVLRPGGRLVLNIKDHVREGCYQDVTAFHLDLLTNWHGLRVGAVRPVATPSLRAGQHGDVRVAAELVIALDHCPEP